MNQKYSFPWPIQGDKIFDSDDASFHVMGDMQESLTCGFKDAGDAIVEAFRQSRFGNRDLLYPAMYCYRQYLELKMKLIISRIMHHAGLEADYKRMGGHSLVKLWRNMNCTAENFVGRNIHDSQSDRITHDQVWSCIEELDGIDRDGDGFRYPDTDTKETLHEIDPFNVKRVVTDIEFYLDAFHDYCTAGER